MDQVRMDRKLPSPESIGSVRNLFIGAMVVSSMAVVLLITVLPIMLCRLNGLYEAVSVEKSAFHRASKAMDEQIELLLEPVPARRLRLVRQADFLDKLERKSYKGRMRMMNKITEQDNLPPEQFDKVQFTPPPMKLLDRQIPTHTSEIRKHILNQLKALSAPAITSPPIDSSGENLQTGQYNPKCPRGQKGAKGKNGIDGLRGENGKPGADGVSFGKVERSKQKCIVCPAGPQGPRGPIGRTGMPGAIGRPALPNQGPVGPPGDAGEPGLSGEMGPDGKPGQNTIRYISVPGPKGETGDQGQMGDIGFPGLSAVPGSIGDVGDQGEMGRKGEVGQPGLIGPVGDVGEDGEPYTYCECPERSPNMGPEQTSNSVVSYYSYHRIL